MMTMLFSCGLWITCGAQNQDHYLNYCESFSREHVAMLDVKHPDLNGGALSHVLRFTDVAAKGVEAGAVWSTFASLPLTGEFAVTKVEAQHPTIDPSEGNAHVNGGVHAVLSGTRTLEFDDCNVHALRF